MSVVLWDGAREEIIGLQMRGSKGRGNVYLRNPLKYKGMSLPVYGCDVWKGGGAQRKTNEWSWRV